MDAAWTDDLTRGGDWIVVLLLLSAAASLPLSVSTTISGTGGAPAPYRPEYVRGIAEELRRDRFPPPLDSVVRLSDGSSIISASWDENLLLGVDGAEDAMVKEQLCRGLIAKCNDAMTSVHGCLSVK